MSGCFRAYTHLIDTSVMFYICVMSDILHQPLFYLEIGAVVFNILFLIYLVREKRVCWIYGIIASLLSVVLFTSMENPLYSESLLYIFYALFGVYGWLNWSKKKIGDRGKDIGFGDEGFADHGEIPIKEWGVRDHVMAFLVGVTGMGFLGYFFSTRTDADVPYADAFSTSFSFVATFMEAHKVLSGWLYWIVLNGFTIWLYAYKEAYVYSGLMVVFTVISVLGYVGWRKKYNPQSSQTSN